jgi:DnaA-homolog protein
MAARVLPFAPFETHSMKQLILDIVPPAAPGFANLVPGRNAELITAVHAFARGALQERVLYVWGAAGAGKSHLCLAVLAEAANAIRLDPANIPDAPLAPNLHVLDAIDQLDEANQAKLFNFINQMPFADGSRLLATGSAATRDLLIRRDLSTRAGSGLSYLMQALSDDEMQAALIAHASSRAMQLNPDIAAYLLRHGRRDMRSQMALLDALDRYSLETGRPVTLPLVREVLTQS